MIILFGNLFFLNFNSNYHSFETKKYEEIQTSSTKQWLENSEFDSHESWNSSIEGDLSDVNATISQGHANYIILGDSGEVRIDETLNDTEWISTINPEFPTLPDRYEINSSGCHVSHIWDENANQTRNTPSVHWKRTITLPVNFSDYLITSASLDVVFNATVTAKGLNPSIPHIGGIECTGDFTQGNPFPPPDIPQFGVGDSVTFYALISDLENENVFQIAINKTSDLGQDTPELNNYTDTPLKTVPENLLISYLTSVLESNNFNFTITLGIDIYSEDNEYWGDLDRWDSLIIRSFNLTFTYIKKVDKFTSISWKQVGDQITGGNVQITGGKLGFDYKINQTWPSILSPNSELRIFINNKQYIETIKLSTATTSFQEAFQGEIDVTALILKDINISVSIQVFLADEFGLDEDITISIDSVYLEISYIEIITDILTEPEIFRILLIIASVLAAGVGSYLIAYQKVLKYPKPVRKVRKYRKTLRRKASPSIKINSRNGAFNAAYMAELNRTSKFLKVKPIEQKVQPEKLLEKKSAKIPPPKNLKEYPKDKENISKKKS